MSSHGDNRCAFNDDICNTVIEKISKADALIVGTPVYYGQPNGGIVTSQYWNIVYGCDKGEAKLDEEGMQTMRTLADNMAFLLRSIHTAGLAYPKREAHKFMNFIR